ncbi:Glutaredoxin [Polaromonas sp. YR568]|uniref:glutaredoxin family protein n=1 Tax=Polaromonas sp. YR568 TaxID=1855301 RepID=UPI0008F443C0|nr:glutaredoxin family protein [Polaromonas sp. YR568]SFV01450.1 Glutaredoxin [Polaromonas sp. YR568]
MRFLAQLGILLLSGWLSVMAAHAQTLYKSVGPDGKTVYSDRPPPDGRVQKTLKFENLPTSALPAVSTSYVEQLRRMRAASPAPVAVSGVVLYSAVWCGYCKLAKTYLARKGVPYQEIDVDTKAGIAALVQAGGGKGVPLLVAGEQRVQGFSEPAYDAIFAVRK